MSQKEFKFYIWIIVKLLVIKTLVLIKSNGYRVGNGNFWTFYLSILRYGTQILGLSEAHFHIVMLHPRYGIVIGNMLIAAGFNTREVFKSKKRDKLWIDPHEIWFSAKYISH